MTNSKFVMRDTQGLWEGVMIPFPAITYDDLTCEHDVFETIEEPVGVLLPFLRFHIQCFQCFAPTDSWKRSRKY